MPPEGLSAVPGAFYMALDESHPNTCSGGRESLGGLAEQQYAPYSANKGVAPPPQSPSRSQQVAAIQEKVAAELHAVEAALVSAVHAAPAEVASAVFASSVHSSLESDEAAMEAHLYGETVEATTTRTESNPASTNAYVSRIRQLDRVVSMMCLLLAVHMHAFDVRGPVPATI